MEQKEVEKLIRNLGYSYDALVSNEIIKNIKPHKLYEDDETLEIELAPGFELVFWEESMRLEMIFIILDKNSKNRFTFQRVLPDPLCLITNKTDTHSRLGKPIYSKTPMEIFDTDLYGWDTYQLDGKLHPECILDIQYDKNLEIKYISISLMDKNI